MVSGLLSSGEAFLQAGVWRCLSITCPVCGFHSFALLHDACDLLWRLAGRSQLPLFHLGMSECGHLFDVVFPGPPVPLS